MPGSVVSNESALTEMCEYAASAFNEGMCDLVSFDCMPGEVEYISTYMKTNHPNVHYTFGSARVTLRRAREQWYEGQKGITT